MGIKVWEDEKLFMHLEDLAFWLDILSLKFLFGMFLFLFLSSYVCLVWEIREEIFGSVALFTIGQGTKEG